MLGSDIRVHNKATFEAEIIATHAWPTNGGLVAFPPVRTEIGRLVNPYQDETKIERVAPRCLSLSDIPARFACSCRPHDNRTSYAAR
jgi:hypothetical protein